ncbi:hypothetical protein EXN53_10845 [Clostridium botulinum]|nr:hypothetical protein [Clostridium botulinum]NFD20437.1 hypothetical protein [Clostridium botulinum]NFD28133.1 hypothetical protein [Clostridium botulinum]NFD56133.1 hypothetical protein [Clostridium botulinum]NFE88389.1 hypothetical protein [Clostridium botulinum]
MEVLDFCKGCGRPIQNNKFIIATLSNSTGIYDVRFFCSQYCLKKIKTVEDYFIIANKNDLIKALRTILKKNLNLDERKYIQALLIRAARDKDLKSVYSSEDLIISKNDNKEWCYICMEFVESEIDKEFYCDSYYENHDDYMLEHNIDIIKTDHDVIVHRCSKCNTTLLKHI